jgi:hypothetical protein
MVETEKNLKKNPKLKITCGSREVQGLRYMGTGFLITGQGVMETSGSSFDLIHSKFPWARAALVVTVESAQQTL